MNIIGGTARGRRLETLSGDSTRPTQAKVRAALFNILQAWTADAAWLDLYAGSGSIGLEAVSRGAKRVVLVEKLSAAQDVIRRNIKATGLPAQLLPMEVKKAAKRLAGEIFDVVYLDPPYAEDPVPIAEACVPLLAADGRLVIEHRADRELPEVIGELTRRDARRYSDSGLSIYARP